MSATGRSESSMPPTVTTSQPPSAALTAALGQIVATERGNWRRDREAIIAQCQKEIADLRAEAAIYRLTLHELIHERLSRLRDGDPGPAGPAGDPGAEGRGVATAEI